MSEGFLDILGGEAVVRTTLAAHLARAYRSRLGAGWVEQANREMREACDDAADWGDVVQDSALLTPSMVRAAALANDLAADQVFVDAGLITDEVRARLPELGKAHEVSVVARMSGATPGAYPPADSTPVLIMWLVARALRELEGAGAVQDAAKP